MVSALSTILSFYPQNESLDLVIIVTWGEEGEYRFDLGDARPKSLVEEKRTQSEALSFS